MGSRLQVLELFSIGDPVSLVLAISEYLDMAHEVKGMIYVAVSKLVLGTFIGAQ